MDQINTITRLLAEDYSALDIDDVAFVWGMLILVTLLALVLLIATILLAVERKKQKNKPKTIPPRKSEYNYKSRQQKPNQPQVAQEQNIIDVQKLIEEKKQAEKERNRKLVIAKKSLIVTTIAALTFVLAAGCAAPTPDSSSASSSGSPSVKSSNAGAGGQAQQSTAATSGEVDADGYMLVSTDEQLKALKPGDMVSITGEAVLYSEKAGVDPGVTYHGGGYVLRVGRAYVGSVSAESEEKLNRFESSAWDFRETLTVCGRFARALESSEPLYGGHDGFVGVVLEDGAEIEIGHAQ